MTIEEIISDTELIVSSKNKEFTIDKSVEYCYKLVPKINQSDIYDMAVEELKNGKCVGIYPEGQSHDQTNLIPFKPGIALIALEAMSKYKDLDLKILPWGIKFSHPNKFRSRLVIEYGKPFKISDQAIKEFQNDKYKAWELAMNQIKTELQKVMMIAPTYTEQRMLRLAKWLYIPNSYDRKYGDERINEINKWLVSIYEKFHKQEEIQQLSDEINWYGSEIRSLKLQDSHMYEFSQSSILYRILCIFYAEFTLMINLILFGPSLIFLLPLMMYNRYASEKERQKVLRKYKYRSYAADVIATSVFLNSIMFYPFMIIALYLMVTFLSFKIGCKVKKMLLSDTKQ